MGALKMSSFTGREKAWSTDGPVLTASLSLNVLSLVLPIAILQVFDRVIPFQSYATLQMLALVLVGAALLEFILRWSRSTLLNAAAEKSAILNHRRFINTVVTANCVSFSKSAPAVHLERFAAISRLRDHFSGQNQTLAIDLPFTAIFVVMIGLIGGWLVLVPLGCMACVFLSAALLKRIQAPIFDSRKTLDARRYSFLAEVLGNMRAVKANTMERQLSRRFELLADQTVKTSRSLIMFSGLSQSYGAVFSQFSVAVMGIFGAFLVIGNHVGLAELAACMLLNGRIVQPLMKLTTLWVQSETIEIANAKLTEMAAIPKAQILGVDPPPIRGVIEAKNLSMNSAVSGLPEVRNVSFKVDTGQIVLLEGNSSTALKALFGTVLGHQHPSSGSLFIDGHLAIDRLGQRGRDGIVCLENNPAIFSGTLLDNISAFGDADQIGRARQYALALGLEKRVHQLSQGFNTPMNEGGLFESDPVNRQLISLARALALQPKILLLNEPSSVLETPEREALSACLRDINPRPTILVFSPDPRLQQIADIRVSLNKPRENDIDAWLEDAQQEPTFSEKLESRGAA